MLSPLPNLLLLIPVPSKALGKNGEARHSKRRYPGL